MKQLKKTITILLLGAAVVAESHLANGSHGQIETLPEIDANTQSASIKELLGPKKRPLNLVPMEEELVEFVAAQLPNSHADKKWQIAKALLMAGLKYRLDPYLLAAVVRTESQFNPYMIGGAGEIGLMQIRPPTAKWLCKKFGIYYPGDRELKNPSFNIMVGAAYLAHMRDRFGALKLALTAYNMGPSNLKMNLRERRMPKIYASRVVTHYANAYRSQVKRMVAQAD